ncbi:MAG: hypothetical protein NTZ13_04075 [Candidatus Parcubacteria bacterium]|nr:hypothetical protein [Candidatus Parcubacteria bacterium]
MAAQKTKKSPALILAILGFFLAFFVFGMFLLMVHPEIEDAMMAQKRTEENFATSLVKQTPSQAHLFPVTITVPYKTVNGAPQLRDVIVYGYGVALDGSKCVQFYNVASTKNDIIKQVCLIPKKEVIHRTPWTSKVVKSVGSWAIWDEIAKFSHSGYYFYQ